MGKKSDSELSRIVDELVDDVNTDRNRLVEFTDRLIEDYSDPGQSAGIAEYVAKLTEAMTRQHQVKVSTIKALAKRAEVPSDDDEEDYSQEIGAAFEAEVDEGSN